MLAPNRVGDVASASATACAGFATGRSRSWRIAALTLAPAVALAISLLRAPELVDDAFITFRYAHNLARGRGLVFNPGEPLLGTSSPLMAALLALAELCGFAVPSAARVLGSAGSAAAVLAIEGLALDALGWTAAIAIGLCVALHPDLALSANAGLETGLSLAAVYAALWFASREHAASAAIASAAACLLRPDGIVVAALCAWRLRRRPKRFVVCLIALTLPWALFAQLHYGSVLPHSIRAKQLIHPDDPVHIARVQLGHLARGSEQKVVSALAIAGAAVCVASRSELIVPLLWMLLQLIGLCASRIAPLFPWYLSPLIPLQLLAAGVALFRGAERLRVGPSWLIACTLMASLAATGLLERDEWRASSYRPVFAERAATYLRLGAWLRGRARPGDRVLAGEVGALGFALPDQVLLDSSGINSRGMYELRRADALRLRDAAVTRAPDPEGSAEWVLAALDRYRPRFIVTYLPWLHMPELLEHPRLRSDYERIATPELDAYIVLERRSR